MGSTRIKGNVKPRFTIGAPGVDRSVDLISYEFDSAPQDRAVLTFEDAENGETEQHLLRGTAVQSTQTASFWRYVWENAGLKSVAYTVAPHGNTEPTADQPHFVGTLTIGKKPKLGGEASTDDGAAFQFEFEWKIDGVPAIDTGS